MTEIEAVHSGSVTQIHNQDRNSSSPFGMNDGSIQNDITLLERDVKISNKLKNVPAIEMQDYRQNMDAWDH